MPVERTTRAKSRPCLLSARPVKTSFSSFFTQLGETVPVEIKLLPELSIHRHQGGCLWSGAHFRCSSCWWPQWMNRERCSSVCRRQAKPIDRDVRPHTWNFGSVKHETKIFMEMETKPAWPTSHEEKHIQGNHDLICIGTLPTPHCKRKVNKQSSVQWVLSEVENERWN